MRRTTPVIDRLMAKVVEDDNGCWVFQGGLSCGYQHKGWAERGRTHCKHGHEFTPENTIRTAKQRHCRACRRARYQRQENAA